MSNPLCLTADWGSSFIDPISGQLMHAKEGAFSETLYIYGQNVQWALEHGYPLKICIVGLGLGYIELIALALILNSPRADESVKILSFEKSDLLRSSFIDWLTNDNQSEFAQIYDEILFHIENHLKVKALDLKTFAHKIYQNKDWIFFKDPLLDFSWKTFDKYHIIQFDPYSRSANPEFWQEIWLSEFLETITVNPCSFTTYASNGPLKRALSHNGFSLEKKPGFGSKRESTFAIRAPK